MKVNIVTVFQSPNYGSFLQGWALQKTVQKKYPAFLVKAGVRKPLFNSYLPSLKRMAAGILKLNFPYVKYNFLRLYYSVRSFRRVKQIPLKHAQGAFIFGSDEIWNLKRNEMNRYPVLWGEGIDSNKKMSYAPSINVCTEEILTGFSLPEAIRNFNAVSVRDAYSKRVLHSVSGVDAVKVVDPTMLISKDEYAAQAKPNDLKDYIAVYLFEPTAEQIAAVKAMAKKMNKQLASVGLWAPWCDRFVMADNPFTYYLNADFVVTNTFHGTAFAINFEKQFITFANGKKKVEELLADYDLGSRNNHGTDAEAITEILCSPIDYGHVRNLLEENRQASTDFLFSALEKMDGDVE